MVTKPACVWAQFFNKRIRITFHDCRTYVGKLKAFDEKNNLFLKNCREVVVTKQGFGEDEEEIEEEKRDLGMVMMKCGSLQNIRQIDEEVRRWEVALSFCDNVSLHGDPEPAECASGSSCFIPLLSMSQQVPVQIPVEIRAVPLAQSQPLQASQHFPILAAAASSPLSLQPTTTTLSSPTTTTTTTTTSSSPPPPPDVVALEHNVSFQPPPVLEMFYTPEVGWQIRL